MRTLIITDLHFYEKPKGHLDAQTKAIVDLIADERPDRMIIMGDVFMRRKPSPSELLAFGEVADVLNFLKIPTTILRGNHDSEDKSDNGVTVLSLYESDTIRVVTQTYRNDCYEEVFIPHYEDESKIIDALYHAPKGYTVYGHFGYLGSMNSIGDKDFNIKLEHFTNRTFLGHIHQFKEQDNVTVLGTPWTTNFGEWEKMSWYAIHDDVKETYTYKNLQQGPRHIVTNQQYLADPRHVEAYNDPKWFTQLRVMLEPGEGMELPEDLNVDYVDFKYNAAFNEEEQSSWTPDAELFRVNSQIIEDYVNGCVTPLDKGIIMDGYRMIKSGEELTDED